jgi:hypothetical protein
VHTLSFYNGLCLNHIVAGDPNDLTLAGDDDREEESAEEDTQDGLLGSLGGVGHDRLMMAITELVKSTQVMSGQITASAASKRKKPEEEDEVKSQPVMLDIPNHHLRDDAHDTLDHIARRIRPFNGKNLDDFWKKRPIKALPVMEILNMGHLMKNMVNSKVIAKMHDRGEQLAGKQLLSSNYSVEAKGGKIKLDNDRTAGAYVYNYNYARGAWEVVDAIMNYVMVLRMVGTVTI